MFYPFLQLDFWSVPPSGYINLLPGQVPPPARQYRLWFLRETPTAPVISYVLGTDSPVTIDADDTRDTRFGNVVPETLSVTLIAQPHWSVSATYPVNDSDVQVWLDEIVNISTLTPRFRGWLTAAAGAEAFDAMPYLVTFTAACGLSKLKNRPVVDLTGAYPIGVHARLRLIESLLAQTGLSLPLTSVCNLTPISDRVNPNGADPLARLYNNGEAFRPAGEDPPSAFEVLDYFCEEMDALLLQWEGRWWFVRVNELPGGWMPPGQSPTPTPEQAYVRDYPPAGSAAGPNRRIFSFTVPCGPGYALRVADGSTTEPQPLVPVVRVEQPFGKPVSLLTNGDFSQVLGAFPLGWDKYEPTHGGFSRLGDGKPENPFRLRIEGAGVNNLYLTFGPVGLRTYITWPVPTREIRPYRLRGRFRLKNTRAAKIVVWAVINNKIYNGSGPDKFLLNEDSTWLYNPPRYELMGIEIENVNRIGSTMTTREEWADFDIALSMFSIVGSRATQVLYYEVGVCQANALPGAQAAERWIEYADLRLVEEVENNYTGRQYTVTNQVIPASNLKRDEGETTQLRYADAAFAPAGETDSALLVRNNADTGYAQAYGFDKPDVPGGFGAPLALWCAVERGAQVARPAHRFDGILQGELAYGPLTILRFTDWPAAARAQLVRWSWEVALCAWDLSAPEIRRTALGSLSGAYLSENGEIPFTPETVGGADYADVQPSLPKKGTGTGTGGGFLPFKPLPKYTGPILWLNSVTPVDTPAEKSVAPRLTVKKAGVTILNLLPLARKVNEPL